VLHGAPTAAERASSAEDAALKAKLRSKVEQAEQGRAAAKDKKAERKNDGGGGGYVPEFAEVEEEERTKKIPEHDPFGGLNF
jgi:hypothetical protein